MERLRLVAVTELDLTIVQLDRPLIQRFLGCRDPRIERLSERLAIIRNPTHPRNRRLQGFRKRVPALFLLAPAARHDGEVGSFSMHEALRWIYQIFGGGIEKPEPLD